MRGLSLSDDAEFRQYPLDRAVIAREQAINRPDERIVKYSELYDPEVKETPIVAPGRIPVHPVIYDSRLYNASFCKKVLKQLEISIDYDLRTMRDRLGVSIDFKGIDNFEATAYPEEQVVEFGYNGARIILAPGGTYERLLRERRQLPQSLPFERAMKFSRRSSGLEVPSWYAETMEVEDAMRDPTMRVTFRNAAILFNNLGIAEVGKN